MPAVKKTASPCHCISVRRLSGLVSQLYDRRLQPVGLSISQYSLLANLDGLAPASISDLAAKVELDRTTLVRNLKPLLERGLIEDLSRPGQRSRALGLTPEGRELLERGRLLWEDAQRELTEKLGARNTELLRSMLERLQE